MRWLEKIVFFWREIFHALASIYLYFLALAGKYDYLFAGNMPLVLNVILQTGNICVVLNVGGLSLI